MWSFTETEEKQIKPEKYPKPTYCSRVHEKSEDLYFKTCLGILRFFILLAQSLQRLLEVRGKSRRHQTMLKQDYAYVVLLLLCPLHSVEQGE